MTARSKGQDPVEAAVERAESAEERAAAARQRAEDLAAEKAAEAQALLAKAHGGTAETGTGDGSLGAAAATGAAAITGDPSTSQSGAGLVTITLAHPLSLDALRRVNIDADRDYNVGEKIDVRVEIARSLIGSGYALGIDPERPEQVRAALAGR